MPTDRARKPLAGKPFTVGDWLIEPALGQASRDGTSTRLRPQLVDLLEHLAGRPNETVSKDELLDAVWADKYIAEAGVARCVAELRQLLGDDPRQPVFIQTVPKRGYRLVAPVGYPAEHTTATTDATDVLPAEVVGGPAATVAEQPEPAMVTALRGTALESTTQAQAVRKDHSARRRRRSLWWLIGTGSGLAAAAVLTAFALWPARPGAPARDRDLVLLAFDHQPADAALSEALRVAIALELERSSNVRIMSDVQAAQLLAYMGRRSDEPVTSPVARELCQRAGSPTIVSSSVTPLDRGYVVSIEAEACGTGDALARAQAEVAGRDDLRRAAGQLAATVRERLQSARVTLHDRAPRPLALASTTSLAALRALSLGDAERVRGNASDAVRLYERAIELDPQFATAYARLGSLQTIALSSILPTSPAARPVSDDRRKADYLRTAFELRNRVSEPERFHIASLYYAWVLRDTGRAFEVLRSWKELYPGSAIPLFEMARLYSAFLGEYDAAIAEGREALRLSPGDVVTLIALVDACIGANRLDEARAYLADASARAPDLFGVHVWWYALAVLSEDAAAVANEIRWSARDTAIQMEFQRYEAQRAMAAGRFGEAAALLRPVYDWNVQRGHATSVAGIRANEALWRAWTGQLRGVAEAAREAAAASDHPVAQMEAGVALAIAGALAPARVILAKLRTSHPNDNVLASHVFVPTLEAAIALEEGRPTVALERLRLAEPYELGKAFRLLPLALRARACLAAGRWHDAAAACSKLVANRVVHPTTVFYPLGYRDLAEASRHTGEVESANEAAGRFRALWHAADAGLLSDRAR